MKSDNESIIIYVSIAVIIISLFFIGTKTTGYALTDTGVVNVSIATSASLNFSTALLDFGAGSITPGQTAIINSEGVNTGSYWSGTAPTSGLILENNGNVNVSFTLKSNKSAATFIGGTTPDFQVKVTNNETGSCSTITSNFSSYSTITTSEQTACSNFAYGTAMDSVAIDVQLTINDDATGTKTVGITATATAVP